MNTKRVLASGRIGPRYGSQLATATGTYRSPNPRDLHILTKLATQGKTRCLNETLTASKQP